MAALECNTDDARGDARASWALPSWEEYSDAAKSSIVNHWSDVEADVSLDTASSVASTEPHRIQRARDSSLTTTPRPRNNLYSFNTQDRVYSSTLCFPSAPCISPRVPKDKRQAPVVEQLTKQTVESELLAQQSKMSAELQAMRQQLSGLQHNWKKTNIVASASQTETLRAPTEQRPWSFYRPARPERKERAVELELDDAVTQWLADLTQEVETLAQTYSPSHRESAISHQIDRQSDGSGNKGAIETHQVSCAKDIKTHVASCAVKRAVPFQVAKHFVAFEFAIASAKAAVAQHGRQQATCADRAIHQVHGYHHERLQRVVEESLAEFKLVRKRYKKQQSRLEKELRTATKEMEAWKIRARDVEQRNALDRQVLECQLAGATEQHNQRCRRDEDDFVQLRMQVQVVRAEKKLVVNQHREMCEVIAQAKERAVALEQQCQALKQQQESATEVHDVDVRGFQDTIRQLQESNRKHEAQHVKDKDALVQLTERLEALKQQEMQDFEARARRDVEHQQGQCTILSEQLARISKEHEEAMRARAIQYTRQLAQVVKELNASKEFQTVCTIETQTDFVPEKRLVEEETRAEVDKLQRRCHALKQLLDKKFQEMPRLITSSHKGPSCHSKDDLLTTRARPDDGNITQTSIQSDDSLSSIDRGKSRARARAHPGSSHVSHTSPSLGYQVPHSFMNETTLATDEATLGAQDMWDLASFTSIDTVNDVSSFPSLYTTPHRQMRSTQEMLALVRQIKHAAASPLESREVDPESSWMTPNQNCTIQRDSHSRAGSLKVSPRVAEIGFVTMGTSAFDDLLC